MDNPWEIKVYINHTSRMPHWCFKDASSVIKDVSRVIQGCQFKWASIMLPWFIKDTSRMLQWCFKDASRVNQGYFKGALRTHQSCFKDASILIQGCFNDSSRILQECFMLQGYHFKGASKMLQVCSLILPGRFLLSFRCFNFDSRIHIGCSEMRNTWIMVLQECMKAARRKRCNLQMLSLREKR